MQATNPTKTRKSLKIHHNDGPAAGSSAPGREERVKILKEIIKLRKEDKNERDERESLLDLYMRAMETATPEQAEEFEAAAMQRRAQELQQTIAALNITPPMNVTGGSQ